MKLAFYIRVSTPVQGYESQIHALREYCARQSPPWPVPGKRLIFSEKVTGKIGRGAQAQLTKLLNEARLGLVDTILVFALDRVGNDFMQLFSIVRELQKRRVRLVGVMDGADSADETASGDFMRHVHAAAAQFGRHRTNERLREGVAAAQKRGVKFGKPRRSDIALAKAIKMHSSGKLSLNKIAAQVRLSAGYLSRVLRGQRTAPKKGAT